MKNKKLFFSSLFAGFVTGSIAFYKWIEYRKHSNKNILPSLFKKIGYTVYSTPYDKDFLLFDPSIQKKYHVITFEPSVSYEEFSKKLDIYTHHFTNEFYIVLKKSDKKNKSDFESFLISWIKQHEENYSYPLHIYYCSFHELKHHIKSTFNDIYLIKNSDMEIRPIFNLFTLSIWKKA